MLGEPEQTGITMNILPLPKLLYFSLAYEVFRGFR